MSSTRRAPSLSSVFRSRSGAAAVVGVVAVVGVAPAVGVAAAVAAGEAAAAVAAEVVAAACPGDVAPSANGQTR
jgi:hypothetical protein